ncbi:MAG: hypothetical protein ACR2M1_17765, partial [Gemmatimonadaceae bacterium]
MPNGSIAPTGTPYTTQGYTFGCLNANDGTSCASLSVLGPNNRQYPGSPALFNNNIYGITTLARADGASFNLFSAAMSPLFGNRVSNTVGFEGFLASGGTVTQSFTLFSSPSPLVFYTFTGFENLSSVRFRL